MLTLSKRRGLRELRFSTSVRVVTWALRSHKQLPLSQGETPVAQAPVHKIRLGRITAAIWENEGSKGTFYNVTINRCYKDGDERKETTSFGRDDLPLVAKAVDQAHTWCYEQS